MLSNTSGIMDFIIPGCQKLWHILINSKIVKVFILKKCRSRVSNPGLLGDSQLWHLLYVPIRGTHKTLIIPLSTQNYQLICFAQSIDKFCLSSGIISVMRVLLRTWFLLKLHHFDISQCVGDFALKFAKNVSINGPPCIKFDVLQKAS